MKPPANQPISAKRQKVRATLSLALADPQIRKEAQILDSILYSASRGLLRQPRPTAQKSHPTLYRRYRGIGFPKKTQTKRRLPAWRSLSPWMRTQIAALCLTEAGFIQVRLHLHELVRQQQEAKGADLKVYMRNRLMQQLSKVSAPAPWMFFVIEDRDSTGEQAVRPHIHGAVQIPKLRLSSVKDGRALVHLHRLAAKRGTPEAEALIGRRAVGRALRKATRNDGSLPTIIGGQSQQNNVWTRKAYHLLRNEEWVSYAFKNKDAVSTTLSKGRLAMSQELNREARRLWNLIRDGEAAMDQWDP